MYSVVMPGRFHWKVSGARMFVIYLKLFLKAGSPKKSSLIDEGKEFYNKHLKDYLTKNNVEYFSPHSEKKASIVERFNRTLEIFYWERNGAVGGGVARLSLQL